MRGVGAKHCHCSFTTADLGEEQKLHVLRPLCQAGCRCGNCVPFSVGNVLFIAVEAGNNEVVRYWKIRVMAQTPYIHSNSSET